MVVAAVVAMCSRGGDSVWSEDQSVNANRLLNVLLSYENYVRIHKEELERSNMSTIITEEWQYVLFQF